MKKFKEIFQNRSFAKLFFANFTSQLGSVIGLTAFMFYLLDRFSSQPAYASVTELMFSLPTLAVFLIVGVLADRMDRQRIAIYCDYISAVFSIALIGVIWIGWMPLVFLVLFLRSAVQKFFFPAENGIMQGILKEDDYPTAAGLNQLVGSIFMLFGNGLGIAAYWFVGIYGAIAVDTISFLASALLMRSLSIPESVRLPNGPHRLKDLSIRFVWKDFKEGMNYIIQHPLLRSLIAGFAVFGIVNGGFSVMPVFILKYKLAPDTYEQLSVIFGIAFGGGVLIGTIIASLLVQKFKFHHMIIGGLFICGIFIGMSAFAPSTWVFLILTFIASLGIPFINVGIGGWMPSIVEPRLMGRVQGWISPLMMLLQSATLGIIAVAFPNLLSIEMLYWIVGGVFIMVALYFLMVLPSKVKQYDRVMEVHV